MQIDESDHNASEQDRDREMALIREELRDHGLYRDAARNLLSSATMISTAGQGGLLDSLSELMRYDDRVRKTQDPECADLILELTNSEAKREFNAAIDAYNADLKRIKREKDMQGLQGHISSIEAILERHQS